MFDDYLDRPLIGAKAIGREAKIVDAKGDVDTTATYYALERGYLDADKFGSRWASTPRRILRAFMGGAK